jgi:hypothetical protein
MCLEHRRRERLCLHSCTHEMADSIAQRGMTRLPFATMGRHIGSIVSPSLDRRKITRGRCCGAPKVHCGIELVADRGIECPEITEGHMPVN